MAKFKRFDPSNRKATSAKRDTYKQHREYTTLKNEHISKRKAEKLYGIDVDSDFGFDESEEDFQPQRIGSGL